MWVNVSKSGGVVKKRLVSVVTLALIVAYGSSMALASVGASVPSMHELTALSLGPNGTILATDTSRNSIYEVDGTTGRIIRVLSDDRPRDAGPVAATAAFGRIWIANFSSNTVAVFSPGSARPRILTGSQYKFSRPQDIAAITGQIAILNLRGSTVDIISPQTGGVKRVVNLLNYGCLDPVAEYPWLSTLFISCGASNTILGINGRSLRVSVLVNSQQVGLSGPGSLAVYDGYLVIADSRLGKLVLIRLHNLHSSSLTSCVVGNVGASFLVIGTSSSQIFIADMLGGRVLETRALDCHTKFKVLANRTILGEPTGVVDSGGAVWISDLSKHRLLKLNPLSGQVEAFVS